MDPFFSPHCSTCSIRCCSFLQHCHGQTLEDLSAAKRTLFFKRGETILQQGEGSNGLYFLQSGVVKLQLTGSGSRPLILWLYGPGRHFGHRRHSSNGTNPYTVTAVEDTVVCFVPNPAYQHLHNRHAGFENQIIASYLTELQQAEARTLLLAYKSVREKVADVLLQIATAYGDQVTTGIRVHLNRQEMADLAGTTREQVCKVLLEFKNEGLIYFRAKHFRMMHTAALQQLAQP